MDFPPGNQLLAAARIYHGDAEARSACRVSDSGDAPNPETRDPSNGSLRLQGFTLRDERLPEGARRLSNVDEFLTKATLSPQKQQSAIQLKRTDSYLVAAILFRSVLAAKAATTDCRFSGLSHPAPPL